MDDDSEFHPTVSSKVQTVKRKHDDQLDRNANLPRKREIKDSPKDDGLQI